MKYYKITCLPRVDKVRNVVYAEISEQEILVKRLALLVFIHYVFDVVDEKYGVYNKSIYNRIFYSFRYEMKEVSKDEYDAAPHELKEAY